jgi:hypothetical protein
MFRITRLTFACVAAAAVTAPVVLTQTQGVREEFTATAIANDDLGSGIGTVIMRVTRWSSDAERTRLVTALQKEGQRAMLDALVDMRSVGTIRTPESLAYDLRYAQQTPLDEGGRRIVLATDRPLSFAESWYQPRSIDYPFTVVQMDLDRNGEGRGTMSYATRIIPAGKNTIVLENLSTAPIQLRRIKVRPVD